MNGSEFISEIENILEYEGDEKLTFDTVLSDVEEWDSLAVISVIAFFDSKFGKKISAEDILKIKTLGELAKSAGINE